MLRLLTLALGALTALAPGLVAASARGLPDAGGCCASCCVTPDGGEGAVSALAPDTCCCAPAPVAPPRVPASAPAHDHSQPAVDLLASSRPVATLPRSEAPRVRPAPRVDEPEPPVRERFGVWLL